MLVETIPRVEKEWKISFDINPHGLVSGWGSIIHLMDKSTNTGDDGGLLPGVWFRSNTTQLYVGYNLNGEHFIHFTADNSLPLNEYSTVEISQRKNNNNEYEFKCTVNGSLIPTGDGSLENPSIASTPKEYTQVKLYASNPWSPAANAEIKNLLFQNVPTGIQTKKIYFLFNKAFQQNLSSALISLNAVPHVVLEHKDAKELAKMAILEMINVQMTSKLIHEHATLKHVVSCSD